jgi:O-antigen/teichoic acid export membrane protein
LLSLPLAVRYLGAERYGVWATVTSTMALLNLLDLGIAGTLTNEIAYSYAVGDRERAARAVTNALAIAILVTFLAGLFFLAVWPHLNWAVMIKTSVSIPDSEISHTMGFAAALMLLGLPASLAARILAGYQELHRNSLIVAVGTALNLAGLLIGIRFRAPMPVLFVLATDWIPLGNLAALSALLLWLKPWLRPRPSFLSLAAARGLLGSGAGFWLIQISAAIVFSSDNVVVSHYLGPAQVTPYSVTWRLVGMAAIVQGLLFPALWPTYAEAYARADHVWLRRAFRVNLHVTLALNLAFAVGLVTFGRALIRWWAGDVAVPSLWLLVVMAIWAMISGCMSAESCLLAAVNRTREQGGLSIIAAMVNLALSIFLVQRIGSTGVIAGTVLSYLLVLVVPQTLIVRQVLRELEPQQSHETSINQQPMGNSQELRSNC